MSAGVPKGPRWTRVSDKPRDLRSAMTSLLTYMGRERRYLWLGMACALAASILSLIGPQLLARITDSISASVLGQLPVDTRLIASLGLVLVVIYALSFLLSVAENRIVSGASERVGDRMRRDLAAKFDRLPVSYLESHSIGDLMSRMTNDTDTVRTGSAESFSTTVDSTLTFVQNAVNAGMATSTDLLKVDIQRNNAALMTAKARNGQRLAMMNLCHILGLPLTTVIEVDQSGFDVDSTEIVPDRVYAENDSIEGRPDYRLLVKQAELKKRNVDFVRSDFLPQLGVMASYGYSYGLKLQDEVLLNQDGFTVMATLKVPIFAWGEGWLKVQSAKKEHEAALEELERLEGLMELERARNRYAVTEAALQVSLARSSMESAELNLKVSRDQFATGMETLVNVLEAQTQWSKCRSEWIEAVADYRLACTKYLKSVGSL